MARLDLNCVSVNYCCSDLIHLDLITMAIKLDDIKMDLHLYVQTLNWSPLYTTTTTIFSMGENIYQNKQLELKQVFSKSG